MGLTVTGPHRETAEPAGAPSAAQSPIGQSVASLRGSADGRNRGVGPGRSSSRPCLMGVSIGGGRVRLPPGRVTSCGVGSQVTTRPVLERDLDALSGLFGAQWSTRHCWCMAFCSTGRQFSFGWFGGGNARRFAAMAARSPNPMGILAFREVSAGEEVVGWCACGPRSRYAGAATTRTAMIRDFAQQEHATVWFVPCFFVRPGFRGQGVTGALLGAAVELARGQGAMAIEGWPIAGMVGSGSAPVGRERTFEDAGFTRVATPAAGRVVMRLALGSAT